MTGSGYERDSEIIAKRARGYSKLFDRFERAPYVSMTTPGAAGALYSTVEDLYRWDRALYTDRLLSADNRRTMFTPFKRDYAYGWGVRRNSLGDGDSVLVMSHGGGIHGFTSIIMRMVEDGHLIVLLDNTTSPNLQEMARGILRILYDKPYDRPLRPVADRVAAMISSEGIEAAAAEYRRLRDEEPDAYDISEGQLNRLGYHYLRSGETGLAIEIFRLNVEAYPEAFNAYDSLGEAYMVNGDKDLAILNYEKSLELNPDNTGAVRMIEKIHSGE